MKTFFLLWLYILLSNANAGAQSGVVASITNIRNNKGICRACIFRSAAAFENNKPDQCVLVPVRDKKAEAKFTVTQGTYAIFIFHDANNNGKMDKNFLGIPSEGYGASRNNLPFAAAPSFEGNKFTVQQNNTVRLSIKLRNL
jgi:uncharacterized protein (DUF2141 family)